MMSGDEFKHHLVLKVGSVDLDMLRTFIKMEFLVMKMTFWLSQCLGIEEGGEMSNSLSCLNHVLTVGLNIGARYYPLIM